ncbi:MAG: hypothetical protein MJA29_06650 [Candidatus Omnitrophica bacterium]|nr:hypothetical protein [Candidatus Omnitrophota bacterium]
MQILYWGIPENWPNVIDQFHIFPKRQHCPEFEQLMECNLVPSDVECKCQSINPEIHFDLIDYIYRYGMCAKHIPVPLILTPGKIIIDNIDMRVINFLLQPCNYDCLDLLANIERLAHQYPGIWDHVLVIHKISYMSGPGWQRDFVVLNSKVELCGHALGTKSVLISLDITDPTTRLHHMDEWLRALSQHFNSIVAAALPGGTQLTYT